MVLRAELLRIKRREAQLAAFLKEGIYVEEEYRDEICFYMHEMEVSASFPNHIYNIPLNRLSFISM